jgi:hypothetical protein
VKWQHSQTIAYFSENGGDVDVDEVFKLGSLEPGGAPEVVRGSTTLRQLSVLPQPVQSPHPPIWEPFATDRSIRYAASHGLNGNFSIQDNKTLKEKIGTYMNAAEEAGWPDYQNRGEFKWGWDGEKRRGLSSVRWVHVEEGSVGSVKRAMEVQRRHWDFFHPFGLANRLLPPGVERVTPERVMELGVNLFGSKQFVLESLLEMRDTCYSEGDFIVHLEFEQGADSYEECEEQMQFFAGEIMPELRRECGGGPDLPESTVSLEPDYTPADATPANATAANA